MNKTLLFFIALSPFLSVSAQETLQSITERGASTDRPISSPRLHLSGPLTGEAIIRIGQAGSPGNFNVPVGTTTGGYNLDFYTWRDVLPDQIGARIRAERINNFQSNLAYVQSMDLAFYTSNGWNQEDLVEKLRIKSNGNVGIGTANPMQKLVVSNNGALGFEVYSDPSFNTMGLQVYDRQESDYKKMQLDASQFAFMYGNVGIGTTAPKQKFVVSNNGALGLEVYCDPASSAMGLQVYDRQESSYKKMQLDASQFAFMLGNVGIGTSVPDSKLTVKGKIHAEEVKIDLNIPGPDYVFENSYDLKSLKEVEKFVAVNKHLPEIPSAAQMKEDGVNMGEMQMKLLQKIEELTLHMIEMNKKLEKQDEENAELKKEVAQLKAKANK